MRVQVMTSTIGDRLRATSVFSVSRGNVFVRETIARFAIARRHGQSHQEWQLKSPRDRRRVAYDRSVAPRPDALDARLELYCLDFCNVVSMPD